MSTQQLKQKGFTIIEVVLVLAIAALIFLMVFIALPALQRNQRDTARKEVLGKVASAVTTYQSNNRGDQPDTGLELAGYVDGESSATIVGVNDNANTTGADSTVIDNEYGVVVGTGDGPGNADVNIVQVITGKKCDPDTSGNTTTGSMRSAAIIMQMENGDAFVCQDV